MAKRKEFWCLGGLAFLAAFLNAIKPLHIDDPMNYYSARHIAQAPLDPFGFETFWQQWPQTILGSSPPVVPYWLGLAYSLGGKSPFLLKMSLFPFALLFVFSLAKLAERFARHWKFPLTIMATFSPSFFPGWNLMLDLPVYALILGSLAVYMRGLEKRSTILILLAGMLAGLAMETKYNGVIALGLIFLYGFLFGRIFSSFLAMGMGLLVIGAYELFTVWKYGTAQFLFTLQYGFVEKPGLSFLLLAMFTLTGGLHIWAGPLAILAGGKSGRSVFLSCLVIILILGAFFLFPAFPSFLMVGLAGWSGILLSSGCLLHLGGSFWHGRRHRLDWFLVLWLCGEILVYLATAPFAAARRVIGILLVSTLLVGRLGSRRTGKNGLSGAWVLASLNSALCLAFYLLDYREAWVRKDAAEAGAAWIRAREPKARIWFVGHWGFQFYAEQAGLEPLVPEHSQITKGDWLILASKVDGPRLIMEEQIRHQGSLLYEDLLPLETAWPYYGSKYPFEVYRGPRLKVELWQASQDFEPRTQYQGLNLPNLGLGLRHPNPRVRLLSVRTLAALGPSARPATRGLKNLLADPVPEVRHAAERALNKILSTEY